LEKIAWSLHKELSSCDRLESFIFLYFYRSVNILYM
jgi:hypothetical protein